MRPSVPNALRASQRARSLSPGPMLRTTSRNQEQQLNPGDRTRNLLAGIGSHPEAQAGARNTPRQQPAQLPSARQRAPVAMVKRSNVNSAASPASPAVSASQSAQRYQSPPATLTGMTRSEMFDSTTPELTRRVQTELAQLTARVADDAAQHLHAVRQVDDMVSEVLARWRRSIRTAIDSMSSLETELVRKGDALAHAHARLADKDVALASVEAEGEAVRAYAGRLETYVAKLVEQLSEAGQEVGLSNGQGAAGLEVAVARLLASARESAGLDVDVSAGRAGRPSSAAAADADRLTRAVKESGQYASSRATPAAKTGHGDASAAPANPLSTLHSAGPAGDRAGRVQAFFEALDATYTPVGTGGSASPAFKGTVAPASGVLQDAHKAAMRNIDATLDRALAQVGKRMSGSPSATATTAFASDAAASSDAAGRVASLHVEFEPGLHAKATVSMLKSAVGMKAGRKVLSVGYNGLPLLDDAALLATVGVPLKGEIEVVFEREHSAPSLPAASMPDAAASVEPTVARAAVPEPALQPMPPSKRSPMPRSRALMSPAPHAAPRGLGIGVIASAIASTEAVEEEEEEEVPVALDLKSDNIGAGAVSTDVPASAPMPAASPRTALSPSAAGFTAMPRTGSGSAALDKASVRAESARLLALSTGEDGRATGSLFHAALAHPSQRVQREAIAASIFDRIDADGSSSIEWEELKEYVEQVKEKVQRDAGTGAATGEEGEEDGEDSLAPDGVPYAVHAAFCSVLIDAGLESAFSSFDVNKDGMLSLAEFTVMMEEVLTGRMAGNAASSAERDLARSLAEADELRAKASAAKAARAAEAAYRARAEAAAKETEKGVRAQAALEAASALQLHYARPDLVVEEGFGPVDMADLQRRAEDLKAAARRSQGTAPTTPSGKKPSSAGAVSPSFRPSVASPPSPVRDTMLSEELNAEPVANTGAGIMSKAASPPAAPPKKQAKPIAKSAVPLPPSKAGAPPSPM